MKLKEFDHQQLQKLLNSTFQQLLKDIHPALRKDIETALKLSRCLLILEPTEAFAVGEFSNAWALSTILLTLFFSPDIDSSLVVSVALASECWAIALDFIDDLQDEDNRPVIRELGKSRVLSVALALQLLAQKSIFSSALNTSSDHNLTLRLFWTLTEKTLKSVEGQHQDLLAELRENNSVGLDECLEFTAAKSGSLLSVIFCMAALLAGIPDDIAKHIEKLGLLLGLYHQLLNDYFDFFRLDKSDVVRNKKTLPLILSSAYGDQAALVAVRSLILLHRERVVQQLDILEQYLGRSMSPSLRKILGISDLNIFEREDDLS